MAREELTNPMAAASFRAALNANFTELYALTAEALAVIDDDNAALDTTYSSTKIVTLIAAGVAGIVASAPGALDTLDELAAALGDDAGFAATVTTALGNRVRFDAAQTLSAGEKTQARANIGAAPSDAATTTTAGLMSSTDKFKLDNAMLLNANFICASYATGGVNPGSVIGLGLTALRSGSVSFAGPGTTAPRMSSYVTYNQTVAGTSNVCGWSSNSLEKPAWFSTTAGGGGFRFRQDISFLTGATNTGHRAMFGLFNANNTVPTDVEPSTLTVFIGFGWDAADTNIQVMHNNAGGTAVKVDTGVPIPRVDATKRYVMDLVAAPGSMACAWRIRDVGLGTEASGTIATVDCSTDIAMGMRGQFSVGGQNFVCGVGMHSLVLTSY